ncbi:MAG TPA: glycosyltransferase family A protein [Pyrinomonadaceae bacterium]|jgi:glycosyltransferase involved in cell wall biosynthesis
MSTVRTNQFSSTDDTPTVSVIIPAYKVACFIGDALDSVFAQTFTDFEVIVINDGSPDAPRLEQEISKYEGSIHYLSQSNRGAGAARNAGLRLARGEYVAFLDGDDVWLPQFLDEQLKLIRSDGGYDLVYADAINFGESDPKGITYMTYNPSHGEVTFKKLLCSECNVVTSTVLARKEPIIRIGSFDEGFPNSQDFDLWLRLVKDANARITYQKKVLVRRRIYHGSLASDPMLSFAGELAVLNHVRRRTDLTGEEKQVLEDTARKRQSTIEVLKGKRHLETGDFQTAAKSFAAANKYHPSVKLGAVLLGLRIAPRLLRHIVQLKDN